MSTGSTSGKSRSSYVVGVDVSTESTKAILFDHQGKVACSGSSSYAVLSPKPGWAEQKAEWWLSALQKSVAEMLRASGAAKQRIVGMAITHQRYSFVPVDGNCTPLRDAILWCDNRCSVQAEWAAANVGVEKIYERTGYVPYVWSVYKILWLKQNEPDVYERTAKWALVQDFLVRRLTGEWATSSSSAAMMGCLDIHNTTRWASDILDAFGISREKFISRIEPAGALLATLTPRAAEELGLPAGLPVYAAAGDQPCGCLGAGVYHTGMVGINGGTSCTVQGVTRSLPRKGHHFIIEINPVGAFAPEVAIHSGGSMLMKWVRDKLLTERDAGWDRIYALAEKAPAGNLGLVNIPYFRGVEVPYWDSMSRGILFGLGTDHGIEHLVRAIIEGLAYEARMIIELMEESTTEAIDVIKMYGGSAVSAVWNQVFADVVGREVNVPETVQATALGAAVCAAAGARMYSSIEEAAGRMTRVSHAYYPRMENSILYSEIYLQVYKPFYRQVKDLMHKLSVLTGYP